MELLSRRDNFTWNKNNSNNLNQDLSNYFHYITQIFVKRESKLKLYSSLHVVSTTTYTVNIM